VTHVHRRKNRRYAALRRRRSSSAAKTECENLTQQTHTGSAEQRRQVLGKVTREYQDETARTRGLILTDPHEHRAPRHDRIGAERVERPAFTQLPHGRIAVFGFHHVVALGAEAASQELPHHGFVFGQEHTGSVPDGRRRCDLIVVGEPFAGADGADTGAAHVFARSGTTWTSLGRVDSPEPGWQNQFGERVAIDQGRVFVAQPGLNKNPRLRGSIFVFARGGLGGAYIDDRSWLAN